MTLESVAEQPIVALPVGTGIRAAFDRACSMKGIRADVALEASAPGAVADLAARGLGVAILSESMIRDRPGLTPVPISDAVSPALLLLVWRPAEPPALRALLDHAHAAFDSGQLRSR